MGDIDDNIYDGEGDLRKKIVQMRHKRAGETKMMARYGTFACVVNVLKRQSLIKCKRERILIVRGILRNVCKRVFPLQTPDHWHIAVQ